MGNAVKVGDIGSDHDGFHPTPVLAGSGTVKVDGIPAARQGDPLAPHSNLNIHLIQDPFLPVQVLYLLMESLQQEMAMLLGVVAH